MQTPLGWRIWTGNGQITDSNTSTWEGAPSSDVQFVIQYFAETFQISVSDGTDSGGTPINQREVTQNYCVQHYGQDNYWRETTPEGKLLILSGNELPAGTDRAVVKTGRTMADQAWNDLAVQAEANRRFLG